MRTVAVSLGERSYRIRVGGGLLALGGYGYSIGMFHGQAVPDSRLPQVDLLDSAGARQESVPAETLEMTSRLIETIRSEMSVDSSNWLRDS